MAQDCVARTFRAQLSAAPLKRATWVYRSPSARALPRSIERGPVEAHFTEAAIPTLCAFRAQLSAAPLKHKGRCLKGPALAALPRSIERGPVEASPPALAHSNCPFPSALN